MAGVQGYLSLYSNDGQTLLYSSNSIQLNGTAFVITQTGFSDDGIATNIDYGTQILGWSVTQGASVPDYAVGTQYTDEDVVTSFGRTLYVVPVQENKFVSTAGLNVLINKIKSKQDKITTTNKLDYSLIANAPTIPTKTSELTNDSGFGTGTVKSVNNTSPDANGNVSITIPTDTGATSITTTGSGNAVTTASYDASTRKITLTKGTTFLTSAPVTSVSGRKGAVTTANLITDMLTGAASKGDKIASKSMGASGYITFSSGLKIAWGVANHGSSAYDWTINISFGVTFSNNPTVASTPLEASGSGCWSYVYQSLSKTGCTLRQTSKPNANGKAQYIYWIAIGY